MSRAAQSNPDLHSSVLGQFQGKRKLGFLPPLCLLDQLLQFGWKAFLLLSVHLAGNPRDTNTQSQAQLERGDPLSALG